APSPTRIVRTMTQVTVLSFAWNIARTTPSVRAATWAETTPAARPAASKLAALIVDATSAGGADADADPADNTSATELPDNTTPRRPSRLHNTALALASRLASLPSGIPSCRAASLRVMPPRSHRTTTPR